jgi:hypothetical protein
VGTDRGTLKERARAAYLRGAEAHSWRERGRWLTEDERRLVMAHYPGDPDDVGAHVLRVSGGEGREVPVRDIDPARKNAPDAPVDD